MSGVKTNGKVAMDKQRQRRRMEVVRGHTGALMLEANIVLWGTGLVVVRVGTEVVFLTGAFIVTEAEAEVVAVAVAVAVAATDTMPVEAAEVGIVITEAEAEQRWQRRNRTLDLDG